MSEPRNRGEIWVWAQMPLEASALAVPVASQVVRRQAAIPSLAVPPVFVVSLLTLATAIYLFRASKHALGERLVAYPEPVLGCELITTRLYSHLRHPMYLSIVIGTWSWNVLWLSLPGLLLSVVVTTFFACKLRYEEKRLIRRFPTYATYKAAVPALFPRWRPKRAHVG